MITLVWWNLRPIDCFERDWIRFLLSGVTDGEVSGPDSSPAEGDVILVANFSRHVFSGFTAVARHRAEESRLRASIRALRAAGRRVGLLHLGDEFFADSTRCYADADFVFRQYHRAEAHARHPHCHFLPLGWTSGFASAVRDVPWEERRHRWCFAGQERRTRRPMIESARRIPGGVMRLSRRWHDPSGLSTAEYAELLGDSRFALCPVGNNSVDCLRVYEALEAGAIPIVEAPDAGRCVVALADPRRLIKHGLRDPRFWRRNLGYWLRAYPNGFPCPQIARWDDLPDVIGRIDPQPLAGEIRTWWSEYKRSLAHFVRTTIRAAFC